MIEVIMPKLGLPTVCYPWEGDLNAYPRLMTKIPPFSPLVNSEIP